MAMTILAPLRRILGKDDRFFNLLEASAEEALGAVRTAAALLRDPSQTPRLQELVGGRRKGKQIHEEISEHVIRTFVTSLEREDIESLSAALYKIPKASEKLAERFQLCSHLVGGVDFNPYADAMERAAEQAVTLVKALRKGQDLERVTELSAQLQEIEHQAAQFVHARLRSLYDPQREFLEALALRDVYELLERIVGRCAEVGGVVAHIILKHA